MTPGCLTRTPTPLPYYPAREIFPVPDDRRGMSAPGLGSAYRDSVDASLIPVVTATSTVAAAALALAGIWYSKSSWRRERRDEHHRALVTSWREGMGALAWYQGRSALIHRELRGHPWYVTLRAHMSTEACRRIDALQATPLIMPGRNPLHDALTTEVERLERKWRLA